MNKDKIILDLCGGTGSFSEPYRQAGYTVYNITLPFYDVTDYYEFPFDNSIVFHSHDLSCRDLALNKNNIYGILAAPPCTDFSLACNRLWSLKDTDGRTAKSLKIVNSCLDIIKICNPHFWVLENPRGRLHKFIGNPSYKFYQSNFGGPFPKPTWLWGVFNEMFIIGPINENPKTFKRAGANEMFQLPANYNLNIDHNRRAAQRSILAPFFCESFYLANQ